MHFDGVCECRHKARMGVPYRASLAREAEYDSTRSLVSTMRFPCNDHQPKDDSQTPSSSGKYQEQIGTSVELTSFLANRARLCDACQEV